MGAACGETPDAAAWLTCESGSSGIMTQATMYPSTPQPPKSTSMTHKIRTSVGSRSKYSANPAQTPAIFRLTRERWRGFRDAGGVNNAAPHWQQKLTRSAYSLPHCGQNMVWPPVLDSSPMCNTCRWARKFPRRPLFHRQTVPCIFFPTVKRNYAHEFNFEVIFHSI